MKNLLKIILLEERIVLDAAATAVIYVNSHAAAGGDGTSWAHAYNNVQDALVKAASTPGADQVWIAQGTYKPSQIYSPNGVTGGASGLNDPHLATFNLPNNVSLYGGFIGTETSLSQAKPSLHPTILSGDLLGNDINNTSDPGYLSSKTDNVWHVVTLGNDVSKTGVTASLTGLTITGGFAAGPDAIPYNPTDFASSFLYSHESGGGIYERWGSTLTLKNDILINNAADYNFLIVGVQPVGGGAIFAMDPGTTLNIDSSLFSNNSVNLDLANTSNPNHLNEHRSGGAIDTFLGVILNLTNSTFIGNTAEEYGGAVSVVVGGQTNISHDTFSDNIAITVNAAPGTGESLGGALLIFNLEPGATATIDNSLFTKNAALEAAIGGGGAITVHRGDIANPANMDVLISNNTFVNNRSVFLGGALDLADTSGTPGLSVAIRNDNFIGNHTLGNGGAISNAGIAVQVDHSNFIGNSSEWSGGAIWVSNELQTLFNFLGIPIPFTTTTITNSNFVGNTVNATDAGFNAINTVDAIFGIPLVPVSEGGIAGGGAIRNDSGAILHISNSSFIGNSVQNGDGGAILNTDPTITFFGNVLTGPSTTTIDNSVFAGNSSSANGGAIASEDNYSLSPIISVSVTNNTFVANRSQNGGALYVKTTLATVTGNTFMNSDDARLQGDQIYAANSLVNGIASSNTAPLLNNLATSNIYKHLDSDDIYLV